MLADGRLDEAFSLVLLAAYPELGGVWRARFEQVPCQPGRVWLQVSLTLDQSARLLAEEELASADLRLCDWVLSLQAAVTRCVEQTYRQLELALEAEPHGRLARTVARRAQAGGVAATPLARVRGLRRALAGSRPLEQVEPRHLALSLLFEVEADARAELLLARQLGEAYAGVKRRGYLDVASRLFPRRKYRVRRGQRIQVLEDGRCTMELCLESAVRVPEADEFLMKIVWLRAGEAQVLRTANHFPAARLLL